MLNRRILRIKAFQTLYGAVLSRDTEKPVSLMDAQAMLEASCQSTRDLYLFMLGIIGPLSATAAERIDAASRKINRTEEEKNPNRKFADNALAKFLTEDISFDKAWKKSKFSWDQYDIFIKSILDDISSKEWFISYMASPESSLSEDCKLFKRIFEEEFAENDDLYAILEDMSIYWTYDIAYALTWCCNSLKDIAKGQRWSMPPLYQSDILSSRVREDKPVESDKAFANKLLMNAFTCYDKYAEMVAANVPSRESDRLVLTDVCLIVCCLAEVASFPTIPVRVSINEYVEISKFFGTPKSSSFVNGLIDRLVQKLTDEGVINKNQ